jgi:hypothetical protein
MNAIAEASTTGPAPQFHPTTIISILTGSGVIAELFAVEPVVKHFDEDAIDAAIIAERRGEPTEPLNAVLDELGLNG